MPTTSKRHFVGQLQQPNAGPQDVELIIQERADITSEERTAEIEWVDSRYAPGNVLRYGPNTTPGTTNTLTAINNAEAAGKEVYFPAGEYNIDSAWTFTASDIVIHGDGMDQSILSSLLVARLITIGSDVANITFRDLTIKSTLVSTVEDNFGLFNSQDFALTNIIFERCKFTVPDKYINAVKIINEDASLTNGVHFRYCVFDDIGRMGIELQNHNFDGTRRYFDITVDHCVFRKTGQQGVNGMGVSLSGWGSNCSVTNNLFDDNLISAIEGVGAEYSTFANNRMINQSRDSAPFSFSGNQIMDGNIFAENIMKNGTGNTVRAEFTSLVNAKILGNHFEFIDTSSYAHFDCDDSIISNNEFISTGSHVALFSNSDGNIISYNRLDNSAAGSNNATVRFTDSDNNELHHNIIIQGTGGTEVDEIGTSTGNKWSRNTNFVTENGGTGSITSGGTTDVITHGLSVTPVAADIRVTLTENPDNTPGAIFVTTITSTQFTVNCENDPGASNLDFSWQAIVL